MAKLVPIDRVIEKLVQINKDKKVLECFQEYIILEEEAMNLFCAYLLTWAEKFNE